MFSVDTSEIKLADLNVPLSSIRPGTIPPMNLLDGGDDGISITLHFGRDQPRQNVTAIVVTIISKMNEVLTDLEFKAVVPRGIFKICTFISTYRYHIYYHNIQLIDFEIIV